LKVIKHPKYLVSKIYPDKKLVNARAPHNILTMLPTEQKNLVMANIYLGFIAKPIHPKKIFNLPRISISIYLPYFLKFFELDLFYTPSYSSVTLFFLFPLLGECTPSKVTSEGLTVFLFINVLLASGSLGIPFLILGSGEAYFSSSSSS